MCNSVITQTIVTVKVDPYAEPFSIHKDLLCHYSGYFRGCFSGKFKEADEKEVTLSEVEPSIFRIFLHWLYTQKILFEDGTETIDNADSPKCLDIIKAYIIGDRYDVPDFRRATFDVVFAFAIYKVPSLTDFAYTFDNLPEESPLRKFLIEVLAIEWDFGNEDVETLEEIANAFTPHLLVRLLVAKCRENYPYRDICQHHEHVTNEEKKACREARAKAEIDARAIREAAREKQERITATAQASMQGP